MELKYSFCCVKMVNFFMALANYSRLLLLAQNSQRVTPTTSILFSPPLAAAGIGFSFGNVLELEVYCSRTYDFSCTAS
jgi:hypothetical protein